MATVRRDLMSTHCKIAALGVALLTCLLIGIAVRGNREDAVFTFACTWNRWDLRTYRLIKMDLGVKTDHGRGWRVGPFWVARVYRTAPPNQGACSGRRESASVPV
jgi:hypothetical protein